MSNLYLWRGDMAAAVRIVMRAEGIPAAEITADSAQQWARKFIQEFIPWWSPGMELHWAEQMMVGGEFWSRLARAKERLGIT